MQPAIIKIGFTLRWNSTDPNSPLSTAGNSAVNELVIRIGGSTPSPWAHLHPQARAEFINFLRVGAEHDLRSAILPLPQTIPWSVELPFTFYAISVVETDYQRSGKHILDFHFTSGELTLIGSLGSILVVAFGNQLAVLNNGVAVNTFRIDLAPNMWIASTQFGV